MTYFTADLHLGHDNIISFCNRPFKNIEEMDKAIINNWNSKVTEKDEVWILGDFSYRSVKNVENYLQKLKGKKHLIIGNHDRTWMEKIDLDKYFFSIDKISYTCVDSKNIIMCHYPIMEWSGYYHDYYMVYGHIHNSVGQPYWNLIIENKFMLNAGVDINNFFPVTFDELIENNQSFKTKHKSIIN